VGNEFFCAKSSDRRLWEAKYFWSGFLLLVGLKFLGVAVVVNPCIPSVLPKNAKAYQKSVRYVRDQTG
jgi:hypothetical protein